MSIPRTPIITTLLRFAAGLKFQNLFLLTLGLFVLDLIIPDAIPFLDELVLGLLTLLFANWKANKPPPDPMAGSKGDYIDAEFKREDDDK